MNPKKPILDLGPMTGSPEYVLERAKSVLDTFGAILEKPLRLIDSSGELNEGACTDCETFVRAPMKNYDAYLDVTHEISHPLFGTNLALTEDAVTKIIRNRLLRRAGISETSPEGERYEAKLKPAIHHLWNILEDIRCNGLWGKLYEAGGELQREQWRNTAEYDMPEDRAQKELLIFLMRHAMGVPTQGVPASFDRCKTPMTEAINLVEDVDAAACLAITARLIDRITDELLENFPPDPKSEAKAKLDALSKALGGMSGTKDPPKGSHCGAPDVKAGKGKLTQGEMNQVTRLLTAREDDGDDENPSSFELLRQAGAEKMSDTIERARQLMALPNKSEQEKKEDLLKDACAVAEIPGIKVNPTRPLPSASPAAARVREHLDKIRMKVRRRPAEDGDDVDIEALLEARLNDELEDAKVFERKQMEAGLELLLLMDLSGSMMGSGLTLTEQAVADVVAGCSHERVKVLMWGFSCAMFFFEKVGSPVDARGVVMSGTNMVQALEVAHHWARASKTQRAVILTTDGMPTSCRAKGSTGNPNQDMRNVLNDMRADGIVVSILGIGPKEWAKVYDEVFGAGRYGLLDDLTALRGALADTAKALVEAHMKRSTR